ncbi:t-SNARE [Phascolomyces articulosus]|uniref:t-SNARE n=1 Tax=Phascolomyces articulosus TaxID=60185 RepID=A0AAD5PG33_9FUNG|nr:t-SNARE [Phascolomyces articulosus]
MTGGSRFTMSRDRLAELRGSNNRESYDRLGDDDYPPPPVPSMPNAAGQQRYNDESAYRPPAQPTATYTKKTTKEQYEMTEVKGGGADLGSTEAFFREIEDIKELIRDINVNISDIEELHGASMINISEEQMAENNHRLDLLSRKTTKLNNEAKKKIKALELSNARLPASSGDRPMRVTQHSAVKKRFIETIQRYQDIERTYQQKYRQRVERQIRIVKPDATPDEIEQVIDSDEAPQIFAQSLMNSNRSGHANAVLNEVQSRHDDIKKIEKTILELHQLFMDMQMMIEQQGEVLNNVEQQVESTVVDLEQGNKDVEKAIVSARATRAKKWCCFVIAIIIAIVIAILVWWFAFDHPGVN